MFGVLEETQKWFYQFSSN